MQGQHNIKRSLCRATVLLNTYVRSVTEAVSVLETNDLRSRVTKYYLQKYFERMRHIN